MADEEDWTLRSKRLAQLQMKNEQVENANRERTRLLRQLQKDDTSSDQVDCMFVHHEQRRQENAELEAKLKAARDASSSARSSYLSKWKSELRSEPAQCHQRASVDPSAPLAGPQMQPQQKAPNWTRPPQKQQQDVGSQFPILCSTPPASTEPLVYVIDDFLSAEECEHLIALGKRRVKHLTKMRPLLQAMAGSEIDQTFEPGQMIEWRPTAVPDALARDVEERIGALMGSPPHDMDGGIKLAQTLCKEGFDDSEPLARVPEGAHVSSLALLLLANS